MKEMNKSMMHMILVLFLVLGCIIGASLLHDVIFIMLGIAVFAFCAGIYQRMAEIRARELEHDEEICGTEVTMEMAAAEGWLKNPKWKSMPEQMLAYRAAAFFARIYCPECLMGVYVEGEPEDIAANKK